MRKSGVLMPVASLPGKYGIGCFSREAYAFVDMLREAGQSYWQILPLGPTGYGDSPYQSFSTFAGNPYFIDPEALIREGLLTEEECDIVNFGDDESCIDYKKIYEGRFPVLKKAYARAWNAGVLETAEYRDFLKQEADWLEDYALYMAIKECYNGKSWDQWNDNIRLREGMVLECCRTRLQEEISFYQYLQYLFRKQWGELKAYANRNGIQIIGDIPIYVAFDSADTWANPKLLALDEKNLPIAVAGCPPDGFSATGQLWGNPLYQWDYHAATGYTWWIRRIAACLQLYDVVRIDHFRGFNEYYAIPYGDKTAENGRWMPGPGTDLFHAIRAKLGDVPIIAEDLGFLTDTVKQLLRDSGFPGMKVIQFAFDSREESDYLPHNYDRNSVVYTGTHDNETLAGWCGSLDAADKEMAFDYINRDSASAGDAYWDFIWLAMRSVSDTCIIPVQDYLGLGNEARINTPSTLGGNWTWRMREGAFSEELVRKMRRLTQVT
ncbi:MAG: 4-alpha-glucanotransferase, partial [Lachnospiraceae bacterium]|nr:4-alpha-glucanotransferase [Lachnospiraceae bacterium]